MSACGPMVDTILQRVRDPSGMQHSRALVRRVLTDVQRLLNAKAGAVTEEQTLTTVRAQAFYPIADYTASAPRVLAVRTGSRDLVQIPWNHLWYVDRRWPFVTRVRPEVFCLVGRDLLVIHPATESPVDLTLVLASLTDVLTDDTVELQLPDEYFALLEHVTTMILLVKGRSLAPLPELMESIKGQVAALGATNAPA